MRRALLLALLILPGACALLEPSGQRFVIFFPDSGATIDDSAEHVVTAAATYSRAHPDRLVAVTGFADPNGTVEQNAEVTRLRVDTVTKQLVADGVAPTQIQQREVGSVPFALSSQESRRVVITVGTP